MGDQKATSTVVTTQPSGHDSWLGYVIAGITLGACFGNMFLAGKIRNVMKMKIPNPEAWRSEHKHTYTKAKTAPEDEFVKSTINDRFKVYVIPPHVTANLEVLQLPKRIVTEVEIKEAYRKAVMKYHPDRIQTSDLKLKQSYETKFKEASASYESLIQHFVKEKE